MSMFDYQRIEIEYSTIEESLPPWSSVRGIRKGSVVKTGNDQKLPSVEQPSSWGVATDSWNDRNANDPLAIFCPGLFTVLVVQLWVLTLREGGVQVEGSGTKRLFRIPLW